MYPVENPVVFIVDDTPENIDVLVEALGGDYDIRVALDGKSALEDILADPPHLILLDIMMPGIDGYEVNQKLKQHEQTALIPVIFITAMNHSEDETKGLSEGAVDFIGKPFNPAVVKARVHNHLSLKMTQQKLQDLSNKLSNYLSPQILQSIMDGKQSAKIGTRRKKLTIFFSDIVEFTSRTDSMESEDLTFILNSYLNKMAQTIMKYGGTLDKFVGDAILVFFGDPESSGINEDAIACVAMALEMHTVIKELQLEWQSQGIDIPFRVRMGITTGYCTVGNFGSEQRMEYTIIGGQVNLASRLEKSAQSNQILISQETWSLVKAKFACEFVGSIEVKGISRAMNVYQVDDFYHPTEQQRIVSLYQGFSLSLDPRVVLDIEQPKILDALETAINRLKQE